MTPNFVDKIKPGLVAASYALALAVGWQINGWRMSRELSALRLAHAQERVDAAAASLDRLKRVIEIGDDLALQLAASENARTLASQEKTDALKRLTTGRRCLDAAAVRLLNQPTGAKPAVPEPAGQPLRADAAFATDTDVGEWIVGAQRAYDSCRGRLDAIRQFETADAGSR